MPSNPAKHHFPELDGVRGVAIVMVMFLHFVAATTPRSLVERAVVTISHYGVFGVDLFFVLSGFLITGILSDTRASPRYFRNFYARRTLRIFPLYYAVLTLLFVVLPRSLDALAPGLAESRAHQAWLWTYASNFYIASQGKWAFPYVSHFWSLAVEEHFYLFWPMVIAFFSRRGAMRVCVALGVMALVLRIAAAWAGANEFVGLVVTPCRLDTLCVGSWCALWLRGPEAGAERASQLRRLVLATALAVAGLWLLHSRARAIDTFVLPLRESTIAVWFGLVIVLVTVERSAPFAKLLRARPLGLLGKYSYGLYVYHGIIAAWLLPGKIEDSLSRTLHSHALAVVVQATAGATLSIAVAVVSYEAFEKRLLTLKRHFDAKPPRPAASIAHASTVGAADESGQPS